MDFSEVVSRVRHANFLKRISIRCSGDAYSFQCGMQLLMWGENVMV